MRVSYERSSSSFMFSRTPAGVLKYVHNQSAPEEQDGMPYALLLEGHVMNISHITKTILNSPLSTAKFRHSDENSPNAAQQSMQAADKLTLSEEVRKLLKRKKAAEMKKGKEVDGTEWEDIYDQEETKRRERNGDLTDEGK